MSLSQLIKQSQDDAGEEVTWKISPVNERLQAVSKHMPEVIKVLAESSKLNSLYIRQCSQNKSSSSAAGRVDMWLSSPLGKACERSLSTADKKGTEMVYSFQTTGLKESITNTSSTSHQSSFQTPPSLSYSADKLGEGSHSPSDPTVPEDDEDEEDPDDDDHDSGRGGDDTDTHGEGGGDGGDAGGNPDGGDDRDGSQMTVVAAPNVQEQVLILQESFG